MSKDDFYFSIGSNAADKDLQRAVWHRNYPAVFTALDDGADPNCLGMNRYPLLIGAIFRGHLRIVQTLLDHGADPSGSKTYPSALATAIRSGHTRIAYILLKFGVEPTWGDANLAALCGRTRLLRTFIRRGMNINHLEGAGGTATVTFVMSAAFSGEIDTVQALIDDGADVNQSNENGWTALHSAAACGHTEIVRLLLLKGADAHAADKSGDTPLNMATKEGHDQVISLLKQGTAQKTSV